MLNKYKEFKENIDQNSGTCSTSPKKLKVKPRSNSKCHSDYGDKNITKIDSDGYKDKSPKRRRSSVRQNKENNFD